MALAAALTVLLGALIGAQWRAAAGTPSNVNQLAMELDGNIATDGTPPPYDWASLFSSNCPSPGVPGGANCQPGATAKSVSPFFGTDFKADWTMNPDGTYNNSDTSVFATGSKDTLGIGNNGWQCKTANNVGNKVDITNFYVTAQIDPSNNHLIAYFGMEKFGSNGTNDIGVWFLQDSSVNCPGTSAPNFDGHHSDGDVLLTAEFTSGGGTASVEAFKWICEDSGGNPLTGLACDNSGFLKTGPKVGSVVTGFVTGSQCNVPPTTANPSLCAITNSSDLTDVPWLTASAAGIGHTVPTVQFYEGGIDLTAISGNSCVARAVGDTRSSATPDATLFDFADEPFAACGGINIQKYIDKDVSGTLNTGDLTSGTDVTGWSFQVTNSSNTVVCSGTTNSSGMLSCANLPLGTYTVQETSLSTTPSTNIPQSARTAGMFNSDPGAIPNTTPSTITKTVNVTVGSPQQVDFGNTCFVSKTFEVDSVPTDGSVTSITAHWTLNSRAHGSMPATTSGNVTLTKNLTQDSTGHTWTGAVNNYFLLGDNLSWYFYVDGDSAHTVSGSPSGGDTISGSGAQYPSCAATDSVTFAPSQIHGVKYKDTNGNGSRDSGEPNLANVKFDILPPPPTGTTYGSGTGQTAYPTGLSACSSTAAASAPCYVLSSSATSGNNILFTANPGTYVIHEEVPAGWVQTQPTSASPDYTVTVVLGKDYPQSGQTAIVFGDAPTYHFSVNFNSDANLPGTSTAATNGTITCGVDPSNTGVGSPSGSNGTQSLASGTRTGTNTYDCKLTVTDP